MTTASVVTFHTSHEDLDKLMESIRNSSIDFTYIVDNSLNDDLRSYFKGMKKVEYIKNINNGYGAGHNIGIKKSIEAGALYHIIINPDIYWNENVIDELTSYMGNHPDCGMIMPRVKNPDDTIRFVCRLAPTPKDLIIRRFSPFKSLNKKIDDNYQLRKTEYKKIMEVPTLSGCFMFIRNSILKEIGGFDDRFFMYMEDVDLSRRIGTISKNIFFPKVSIYHAAERGSYKNLKLLKYHIKSAIKYFNKWGWFFDSERNHINNKCKKSLDL